MLKDYPHYKYDILLDISFVFKYLYCASVKIPKHIRLKSKFSNTNYYIL